MDQADSFIVSMFVRSEFMNCVTGGKDWREKHVEWIRKQADDVVRPAWPKLSDEAKVILLGVIQKQVPEWRP